MGRGRLKKTRVLPRRLARTARKLDNGAKLRGIRRAEACEGVEGRGWKENEGGRKEGIHEGKMEGDRLGGR